MNKIRIDTLTPVHIGSGEFLHYNTDFVTYNDGEGTYAYVIDPGKILSLIGVDHVSNWTSSIERGDNTTDLVRTYSPKSTPIDFSKRSIFCITNVKDTDTLKECIHDGRGLPYIPGSSIKGAIRTAILSQIASSTKESLDQKVISERPNVKRIVSAKRIESDFFGGDPNSDVFRFIRVGDAYFERDCEIATRVINLNIRHSDNLIDKSKPQLIEAIEEDRSAEFNIKIDSENYQFALQKWASNSRHPLGELKSQFADLKSLFKLINNHSLKLVDEEISYWTNVDKVGAEDYISNMNNIRSAIRACKENECVLRIGHASGWRFITGAWAEAFEDNTYFKIVSASRPGNDARYSEYDFPKSRRIDEFSTIFGFVKLTI